MATPYQVGVHLAMTSNHAPILTTLARDLTHIHGLTNQLTVGFNRLTFAVTGALAAFTAGAAIHGLVRLIEKTKDLSHEVAKLGVSGMGAGNVASLRQEALNVIRSVPGINERQALSIGGAAYSIMGAEEARRAMLPLARFGVAAGGVMGKEFDEHDLQKVIRSADMLGRLTNRQTKEYDPERFQNYLDFAFRAMAVTHGAVNPSTLLNFAQQAGPAGMLLSDQGLASMAIMMQYMGGFRSGTALMSLMQQFTGGQMKQPQVLELQRLGLLSTDDVVAHGHATTAHHLRLPGGPHPLGHHGKVPGSGTGGITLSREARERLGSQVAADPMAFVVERLLPAMVAQGITDPEQQIQEVFTVFGRQTTQRLGADFIQNWQQMISERQRMGNAEGVMGALGRFNKVSVQQNLINLNAAWDNLLYAVAGPNSENVIGVLKRLTDVLNRLAEFSRNHPDAIANLGKGIAILIGALAVGGVVAMIAALGPYGWIAAGITALVAAVVTFVPLKDVYRGIATGLSTIGTALSAFWDRLQAIWERIKGMFTTPGGIDPGNGTAFPPNFVPGSYPGGGFGGGLFQRAAYHPAGASAASVAGDTALARSATGPKIPLVSVGGRTPASIRYNNPGAQWDTPGARAYGMDGYGIIGGGNHIARFPTAEQGAAANMDLFWSRYTGIPLGKAGQTWTGHHGFGIPGYDNNMVVTREMMKDEGFVISMMRAIAGREAGRRSPLTDDQWHKAYEMFRHRRLGDSPVVPPPQSKGVTLENHTYLDGAKIAHNTMKHVISGLNGPAKGSRLPDYTSTRPQAV